MEGGVGWFGCFMVPKSGMGRVQEGSSEAEGFGRPIASQQRDGKGLGRLKIKQGVGLDCTCCLTEIGMEIRYTHIISHTCSFFLCDEIYSV